MDMPIWSFPRVLVTDLPRNTVSVPAAAGPAAGQPSGLALASCAARAVCRWHASSSPASSRRSFSAAPAAVADRAAPTPASAGWCRL